MLATKLGRYLNDPQVDVNVAGYGGRVSLEGAFANTAPQDMTTVPLTLGQAIGRAGIDSEQADISGLMLMRDGKTYRLDQDALNRNGAVAQDIYLKAGDRIFLPYNDRKQVYVVDAVQMNVLQVVKAGARSNGIAVHPDGSRVYVSNGGAATVSVIDTATNAVVATIPVGQRPWNMALTPDGGKLYVACGRSGAVSVIDTRRQEKIADVAVGKLPWGVAIR